MSESFIGKSWIESSYYANLRFKLNKTWLGKQDHKPNTEPFINWYQLQLFEEHKRILRISARVSQDIFPGNQEVNITARSQNYGDFKSDSTLGERKPKKLTIVSTPLRKYTALVQILGKHITTIMSQLEKVMPYARDSTSILNTQREKETHQLSKCFITL